MALFLAILSARRGNSLRVVHSSQPHPPKRNGNAMAFVLPHESKRGLSGEEISMAERDQNEGSGQQPPIGQQSDDQTAGQSGQQEQGQQAQQQFGQQGQQPVGQQGQGQQPLGQQSDSGSQEPGLGNQANQEYGQSAGQSSTGQASQDLGRDTETLSEGSQSTSGSSQSGQNSGGFVGNQDEDSGEYLQQGGTPQAGFAEQGSGAPNEGSDIERDSERSQNRDSDIEGSSGNI